MQEKLFFNNAIKLETLEITIKHCFENFCDFKLFNF